MSILNINTRLFSLTWVILFLAAIPAGAQGFFRHYPFFTWTPGGAESVFPQADGSFRLTATSYPDFGPEITHYWLHTNASGVWLSGDTLTQLIGSVDAYLLLENGGLINAIKNGPGDITVSKRLPGGGVEWAVSVTTPAHNSPNPNSIAIAADGSILVNAELRNNNGPIEAACLFKFSANGALIWQKYYTNGPLSASWRGLIHPTPDNGCVVAHYDSDDLITYQETLTHFDEAGNQVWSHTPDNGALSLNKGNPTVSVNATGEVFCTLNFSNPNELIDSVILRRLSPDGIVQQETNLSAALGTLRLEAQLVFSKTNGGAIVVLGGGSNTPNSWVNYVLNIQPNGSIGWTKPLTVLSDALPAFFGNGHELPDGSLVLYGYQSSDLFLIKMSADGTIYPHTLTGAIARDSTFNCAIDAFDPPLAGWVVTATGSGHTMYASSDPSGQYTLSDVDTGTYQVVLTPPGYLWQPCEDSIQVQFAGALPQTETVDFPVQSLYDCPLMQVDIATPFLRRCFGNAYAVNYCNAGNQPAPDAGVTVTLDPLLEFDSASIPYTQDGQTFTFELGTVAAGECGTVYVFTTVSCDAVLGQALCAEAHIFPDTVCAPVLPGWSGAQVEVSAQCDGDSVRFRIHNTGSAPMPTALDFIIVDDHVITRQGLFQLPAGAIQEEVVFADGSTWRLIAQQEPGYPFGAQMPAVGVEACTPNPNGGFTTGMLNMFPNFSGNPFDDVDCHTVIGAWDPNDKQAFPAGVDAPHYIEQNQPIDYLIRFQNTGTDTAFTVVLRDTLSPLLDPATLRPGAASHPFTWTLGGAGILTVVFDHILLPDSNVNETASHGFVQFHVDQQRDNTLGAVIENRAGIYFDFNVPVLTNTVFHTVGKNFLPTATGQPNAGPRRLAVWPNPATGPVRVDLGPLYQPGQQIVLRDALGRPVSTLAATAPVVEIPRAGLAPGLYWLELRDKQTLVAVGKVAWGE